MSEVVTKVCAACDEVKMLDDFSPHAGRPDGRQSWCRECYAIARRRKLVTDEVARAKNRAQVAAYNEALRRLRDAFPREFQALYRAAREKRGMPWTEPVSRS